MLSLSTPRLTPIGSAKNKHMARKHINSNFGDGDIEGFISSLKADDLEEGFRQKKVSSTSSPIYEVGSLSLNGAKRETHQPVEISNQIKQYQYPDYSEYAERSRMIREQIQKQSRERQKSPTTKEYVSRGALKLDDAVECFDYDFTNKIVLDIGSSTGGFTEYALMHGARKVIAIEKGTNQMKSPLRDDPDIDLREKTDIFTVTHQSIGDIDTILADVSFISLTKILSYAKKEFSHRGHIDFLVMLKPQFEADPSQLIRGIVKNERIRRDIIKKFENWCKRRGFVIKAKHDNGIPGRNGNLERFYWLILSR